MLTSELRPLTPAPPLGLVGLCARAGGNVVRGDPTHCSMEGQLRRCWGPTPKKVLTPPGHIGGVSLVPGPGPETISNLEHLSFQRALREHLYLIALVQKTWQVFWNIFFAENVLQLGHQIRQLTGPSQHELRKHWIVTGRSNRQFFTTPPYIAPGGILVGWPFKIPTLVGLIPTVAIPIPDQPPSRFLDTFLLSYQKQKLVVTSKSGLNIKNKITKVKVWWDFGGMTIH